MREKLKILIVASEAVPFAKEGGLGDVVGALPGFLRKLGHDVRVVLPRYFRIDKEKHGLKRAGRSFGVPMGTIGTLWGAAFEGKMFKADVPIYFIDNEQFYGRAGGLYNAPDGHGYIDNNNRFVFLSRAALELCKIIKFKPDIIHVHDWHSAIIPVYLNTIYKHDAFFKDTATLLTIHNMQYQGDFNKELMHVLAIGWEHFNLLELELYDKVNLLKGGVHHATLINTVSPTYAKEIQTSEFGCGLQDIVKNRASDLYGILNGVDYEEWNPETDPLIAANYSEDDMSGKAVCKKDLQRTFGLPERADIPVIGMVSRLVNQKGIDILAKAMHRILACNIQFAVVGTGEPWAHSYFSDIQKNYPNKFACYIGYNNTLAHKIEAGADFFLMPSRFEPCGLNQMYSLRYGTLPIVRAVGGLNDSVANFNKSPLRGTGFKFRDLTEDSLCNTIARAVHTYCSKKDVMQILVKRAMQKRFTWGKSAKKYEEVYCLAVKKRIR